MNKRIVIYIGIQILTLLICTSILHAWTGDTWSPVSRETILRIAGEMTDFS